MRFTLEWFKAAGIRMLRTMAQVALGMITVGMTLSEIDWMNVLSVSAVAAIYSFLTSIITDLPEVQPATPVPAIPEVQDIDAMKKEKEKANVQ